MKLIKLNTQDAGEIWRSVLPIPEFDWEQSEIQRHNPHCKFLGHNLEVQLKNKNKTDFINHFLLFQTIIIAVNKVHTNCSYLELQRQITLQLHQKWWVISLEEYLFLFVEKTGICWKLKVWLNQLAKVWYWCNQTNIVMSNKVLSWNFIKKTTTKKPWIKVKMVIKNRLTVY